MSNTTTQPATLTGLFKAIITMLMEFALAITGLGKLAGTAVRTTQHVSNVLENMAAENDLTKEVFAQMRLTALGQYKSGEMDLQAYKTKIQEIKAMEAELSEE